MTITGPTAGVDVSGGGTSGVFQVDGVVTAAISGLTISGGSRPAPAAACITRPPAATTLTNCTISGNSANNSGGGLASGSTATLTLTDCTISGNSAKRELAAAACIQQNGDRPPCRTRSSPVIPGAAAPPATSAATSAAPARTT